MRDIVLYLKYVRETEVSHFTHFCLFRAIFDSESSTKLEYKDYDTIGSAHSNKNSKETQSYI